jgi:hypothetical protein
VEFKINLKVIGGVRKHTGVMHNWKPVKNRLLGGIFVHWQSLGGSGLIVSQTVHRRKE